MNPRLTIPLGALLLATILGLAPLGAVAPGVAATAATATAATAATAPEPAARNEGSIASADAGQHVGETVTVCGRVAAASHFDHIGGEPTFINFDRPYPQHTFTVVIWGEHAGKFERPPHLMFADREICVTGTIVTYRGKPQIEVRDPEQIRMASPMFVGDRFSYEERVALKAVMAALGFESDYGTGEWDEEAEAAMQAFQQDAGLDPREDRDPGTLRALAVAVEGLSEEDKTRILRLFLLNLAQREELLRAK